MARNPYSAQCCYTGPAGGGSSNKEYCIDVPVYAGPDLPLNDKGKADDLKDAWMKIRNEFTVQSGSDIRTYQVVQNMANSKIDSFKIYPPTGLEDKDGNSYFPYNTWGFAVSGRNFKQYNSPMLLDSLNWNNYVVNGLSVDFTSVGGTQQKGQFECCLIPNGSSLPPTPITNMPNSFKVALATGSSRFDFNIKSGNTSQPIKDLRGIQERFDSNADFGILYFRCTSVSDYEQPTLVGNARITIVVTLLNNDPNPFAQLIGAWIEAGYPILPDDSESGGGGGSSGGSVEDKIITSTMMLSKAPSGPAGNKVELKAIARGRARMPRWYMIPKEGDKHIMPLAGAKQAVVEHFKMCQFRPTLQRTNEVKHVDFPAAIGTSDEGFIKGNDILKAYAEGDDESVYGITTPHVPFVDNDTGFVKEKDLMGIEVIPAKSNPAMKFTYQTDKMDNPRFIAEGGVRVKFAPSGSTVGLKAGVTFKDITSFAVGADQKEADGGALHQISLGYSASEVNEHIDPGTNGFLSALGAFAIAGIQAVTSNDVGAFKANLAGANMAQLGADSKTGSFQTKGNRNAAIKVQSSCIEVPANATHRSKIGKITSENSYVDHVYLEEFFGAMPAAKKYGLLNFDPEELTADDARITVTGQAVNMTQGLMAFVGDLPREFNPTFSVDVKSTTVLVASRVDPTADPQGFMETCIPITSVSDSWTSGHSEGAMYRKPDGSLLDFQIKTCKVEGNKIRETVTPLSAFYYAPLGCDILQNFTVAWPDQLYDPVKKDLTPLEAGEKVYFSILKGSARTFATVVPPAVTDGYYNFVVFPDLTNIEDLPVVELGLDGMFVVETKLLDKKFTKQARFSVDGERRFTLQSTVPNKNNLEMVENKRCLMRKL